MATIFSKIIAGEIPCCKIAENENCFAFLDINPMAPGHTLVVPKIEDDYIFNLPDNVLQDMIVFAKRIATAQKRAIPCLRIGMGVLGLEVPHAHIHLIPLQSAADFDFNAPKLSIPREEMEQIAADIRRELKTEQI